jgi:RNA polymerase sigma factor (sigma-70 family)
MPMPASTAVDDTPTLPSGFPELYAEHYDFVWRCALRLGATHADVEDIVQETFLVALRRYDPIAFGRSVHGEARPSTWLFGILRNVLRNHARGERRRRARLDALAQIDAAPPPSDARSALGLRLLDEFLGELEPDRREVFVLAELEGLRGPEIARTLDINHNTVRSRLRSARQAFQLRFEHGGEPLVDLAANESAPREARARGLALLLAPAIETPVSAASIGTLGWLALGSAVLIAVVVIAGREPAKTESPEPVRASLVRGAATVDHEEPAPAALEPEPAILVQARDTTPAPPRPRFDTDAALERLTRARQELLDGDALGCLALLEDQRGWPTALDARRVALEIGASCTLGRSERARILAQDWIAAHPDASTVIDLRTACWTTPITPATSGQQAP